MLVCALALIRQLNSLLSKKIYDREALTHKLSNIKPRLPFDFFDGLRRLERGLISIILLGILFLLPFQTAFAADLQQNFVLPHTGYVSTYYSSFHPGIDVATSLGDPIFPITSGAIEATNFGFPGYGNHVIIIHPDGFKSLYGHMGKIFVKPGQGVGINTPIGEVGMTGHTSGPHTHLEITHNGTYINPLTVLPQAAQLQPLEFNNSTSTGGGNIVPEAKPELKLRKTLKPNFN